MERICCFVSFLFLHNPIEYGSGSLKPTLIEKAGFIGGSTSVSGGGFIKYLDETGAYDEAWIRSCIEADLEIIKKDLQTPFNSDLHYSEFLMLSIITITGMCQDGMT